MYNSKTFHICGESPRSEVKDSGTLFFLISFTEKAVNMEIVRPKLFLLFAAPLAVACLSGGTPAIEHRENTPRSIVKSEDRDARTDTAFYVLGVEFPTRYDWRKDSLGGNVDCRLVYFEGQKRILEIDAGPNCDIRPFSDRNRLWGRHLYSDFIKDSSTVICRDGEVLFSYDGRELMRGFMVNVDGVHTLGQNRGGEGFSYRINGREVFSSSKGFVLGDAFDSYPRSGALDVDDGKVCFAYYIGDDYYFVREDDYEAVEVPEDVGKILDIRSIGGEIYVAAESLYGPQLVLVGPEDRAICQTNKAIGFDRCRIVRSGDEVYVKAMVKLWKGGEECCLWTEDGERVLSGGDFFFESSDFAYYCSNASKGIYGISAGGEMYAPQTISNTFGPRCGTYRNGAFYLALTPSVSGFNPFVWVNGRELAFAMNGYLMEVASLP